MEFIGKIFTFLTSMPGNLVYILVLAYVLTSALSGAVLQWRAMGYPQARRMMVGLSLLLAGQLALFAASALVWANILPTDLLPPLDRAVLLFSLIWIVWLWAFPEPTRMGDAASILLSLLALVGLTLGIASNGTNPTAAAAFNKSAQAVIWDVGSLGVLLLGALLLFVRRPKYWATGLAVILMMAVGCAFDIFLPDNPGDYSGVIRFLSLAAYPLMSTLLMRFPVSGGDQQTNSVAAFQKKVAEARQENKNSADLEPQAQAVRERRRYSTDPKTLQTMLNLAAEVDANKINQQISRSVAQAMLSDLCFVIYIGEDKSSLHIASGYDLIREENLEGGMMSKDAVPTLANAVLRGRSLRLPASTTSVDLKGLGDMLGLTNPGNMLVVPINSEKGAVGSLMLLSPYSNRLWNADDQTFVTSIATSFVPIIERGRRNSELERERDRIRLSAEEAQTQAARLQASNTDLNNQLGELKSQLEQVVIAKSEQKNIAEKIEKLEKENEKLRIRMENANSEPDILGADHLEKELRQTLKEMAQLQNQLADANIKILEFEKQPAGVLTNNQAEVIASISQELRQPMSSIIGYADLLLGESVGILGALQRKFIERIRASTERIGSLIDDLIQLTTIEAGLNAMKPETVDLNLIIDNAMAYTSSQLREKNITLRIDIPESIHPIHADREALQQILIHLLQNAGAASPVEGAVTLRVRMKQENAIDHVQIQITDTGGGIPEEDLARVFSRLYRADNALIQGVGDTGVGLSIAKTLSEAQGGRIWVETDLNKGSTFNVLLPLKDQPMLEPEKEA
jgi:signal transduction histidine kinase